MKAKNKKVKNQASPDVRLYSFYNSRQVVASVLSKIEQKSSPRKPEPDLSILPAPGFEHGKLTVLCSLPSIGKTREMRRIRGCACDTNKFDEL